jgi:DNA repair protein RadC
MITTKTIAPSAEFPATRANSIMTPLAEAIEAVARQGARALRTKNQPQEWKLISLRECPTPEGMQVCDTPDRAAAYWREHVGTHPFFNPECECFIVVMLNTRRRIKGHCFVSIGTMDMLLVHPREVFRLALVGSAHSILIMHNHPSGDPTPSDADIRVTRDLIRAGQLIKIEVLDHVIVGSQKHCSLRELGYFY